MAVTAHVWQTDEDGAVDNGAFDIEGETMGHNGPRCIACGFFFCEHCRPDWWQSECPGVRIDPGLWKPSEPVTDDVLDTP